MGPSVIMISPNYSWQCRVHNDDSKRTDPLVLEVIETNYDLNQI